MIFQNFYYTVLSVDIRINENTKTRTKKDTRLGKIFKINKKLVGDT